jgi:hypothetical protein
MKGSPRIGLYAHGRRLSFVYRYDSDYSGDEPYGPEQTPRATVLRPDSDAYFFVGKFRCEYGFDGEASEIRVLLPGDTEPLRISLPAGGGEYGVSAISYCPSFTPGNRVDVSTIHRVPPPCFVEDGSSNESEREIEKRDRECEADYRETVESNRNGVAGKMPAWEEE